ncbi:MAG TPA: hypothetical protein VIK24_19250, partial [Pyrinomonadaceae bacterium]
MSEAIELISKTPRLVHNYTSLIGSPIVLACLASIFCFSIKPPALEAPATAIPGNDGSICGDYGEVGS